MRGECGAINNNDTVITCVTIFALPRSLALIVCPFESATPRRPVTANSRPTMMNTIQAGTRSSSTKQMKAAEMSSLSARGSRSLPKLVICLRRRAMYPSSRSVVAAERKISSASHSVVRTSPPRSSSTLRRSMTASSSGTKKILSTVRAFGRFMLLRRVRLPKPPGRTGLAYYISGPSEPWLCRLCPRRPAHPTTGACANILSPRLGGIATQRLLASGDAYTAKRERGEGASSIAACGARAGAL